VRVFAALPLPAGAAAELAAALEPLRRLYPRIRWVPAQGLHATLHFFGEVPEENAAALQRLLGESRELRRECIPARLGRLGQFPPRGSPRVMWAGIDSGAEQLKDYWSTFEETIAPLGWSPDPRGFTPHVTVARAGTVALQSGWEAGVQFSAIEFLVEECVLFQSILGRAGAEYVPLTRIAFGKEVQ
jgi:2'-5' RNA ligase